MLLSLPLLQSTGDWGGGAALPSDADGGIFVLDMGPPVKIVDLARQMIRLAGLRPEQVWAELERREGISGIVEKASRPRALPAKVYAGTRKIP